MRFGQILTSLDNAKEVESRIEEIESETQLLINNHRLNLGHQALRVHKLLKRNSKEQSNNMAVGRIDFGHYGFKRRYNDLKKELAVIWYGENLAYNRAADPAPKALDQWMASPSHRQNLERDMYTHSGLSVSLAENGFYYFTHILVRIVH